MWAANRRLSHQKVETHTSRKKGVMITEVRAMVTQASMEKTFSSFLFIRKAILRKIRILQSRTSIFYYFYLLFCQNPSILEKSFYDNQHLHHAAVFILYRALLPG